MTASRQECRATSQLLTSARMDWRMGWTACRRWQVNASPRMEATLRVSCSVAFNASMRLVMRDVCVRQ